MTVLITDSFENGLTVWSSVLLGDGTAAAESANIHSGYGAAKVGAAVFGASILFLALPTSGPTNYARVYVKFSTLPAVGNNHYFLAVVSNTAGCSLYAGVYNNGVNNVWRLVVIQDSVETAHDADFDSLSPVVDKWFCVEVFRDITNDVERMYINGTMVLDENDAITGTNDQIYIGVLSWSSGASFFLDDVVVADAYIGPSPTVIFQDGFEQGDFSKWTLETAAISSAPVHQGVYSAVTSIDWESIRKTISTVGEIYVRFYFYLETPLSNGDEINIFTELTGWFDLGLYHDGTSTKWKTKFYDTGYTVRSYVASTGPSIEKWYCVEFWFKKDTAGGCKLFVNGVIITSVTETTVNQTFTTLLLWDRAIAGSATTHYFDDVIFADGYIGLADESKYTDIHITRGT